MKSLLARPLFTRVTAALVLAMIAVAPVAAQDVSALADAKSVLPSNVIRQAGFIDGVGVIFAASDPDTPTYGVYKGKVVSVEYTFRKADLTAGKSWKPLSGLTGLTAVDHASLSFEPFGTGVIGEPLYALRLWFASSADLAKMKASDAE